MYKTGDMARFLSNGNIEFLGRSDFQLKIRGFRIEPGEIEIILTQSPEISEAVVTAYEYSEFDKRLVAYITPKNGIIRRSIRTCANICGKNCRII